MRRPSEKPLHHSPYAQTAVSTGTVGASLASAGKAMAAVGAAADLPAAAQAARQFALESHRMEAAGDMVDSALDTEDYEEEADEVVDQVLDEIGVDISAALAPAGRARIAAPPAAQATRGAAESEDDLAARLAALTR